MEMPVHSPEYRRHDTPHGLHDILPHTHSLTLHTHTVCFIIMRTNGPFSGDGTTSAAKKKKPLISGRTQGAVFRVQGLQQTIHCTLSHKHSPDGVGFHDPLQDALVAVDTPTRAGTLFAPLGNTFHRKIGHNPGTVRRRRPSAATNVTHKRQQTDSSPLPALLVRVHGVGESESNRQKPEQQDSLQLPARSHGPCLAVCARIEHGGEREKVLRAVADEQARGNARNTPATEALSTQPSCQTRLDNGNGLAQSLLLFTVYTLPLGKSFRTARTHTHLANSSSSFDFARALAHNHPAFTAGFQLLFFCGGKHLKSHTPTGWKLAAHRSWKT